MKLYKKNKKLFSLQSIEKITVLDANNIILNKLKCDPRLQIPMALLWYIFHIYKILITLMSFLFMF